MFFIDIFISHFICFKYKDKNLLIHVIKEFKNKIKNKFLIMRYKVLYISIEKVF